MNQVNPKNGDKSKMINVFHIVPDKVWGGAEQYAFDLASRLRTDPDFYIEVVTRKREAIYNRFRTLEIPMSMLPLKGMTDWDSPVRFARLLRAGQNVVHVHTFHDAVTACLAKHIAENPLTRVVLTLHGVKRPRINYVSKKVYRELDRVVFVSQMMADAFQGKYHKFDPRKGVMIHESVLPVADDAPAVDLRQRYGIADGQALLMYHGRLTHEKGLETLLQAVSQLDRNTFHLVIAGEGNHKYVGRLKAFIVANQLVRNVTFLGFQDNVQPLIKQCDLGVLPSLAPEAMGIANLEYMMQGKAHITTNNGAQREYVTDGQNGLLVDPGNHLALAAAINSLVTDPVRRSRMGMQAQRDFNDRLNYDTFYRQITDLYRSLF